jgi:zinc protease
MEGWLHGNDPRFSSAPQEKLASYTINDARAWLTPELSRGYLELSIVGDFDETTALPALLASFGALPPRASQPAKLDNERVVDFPKAPAAKDFTYESKIPQGLATVVWHTGSMRGNMRGFRRLNLLGAILGDRLREEIRERLGASYSPDAGASGSDALENMGYLIAESAGKPEDLPVLLETIRNEAAQLASKGASEDELDRALKPTLGMLEKSLRDNTYWLNTVLSQSQADPERIELARGRDEDYKSITLEEINQLAAKHLGSDNALQVTIKPAE